jgi:hypothetical protein
MDENWQRRVRERAYQIWERRGREEGRMQDHWHQAEEELRAEAGGSAPLAAATSTVPGKEQVPPATGNPIARHIERATRPGYAPPTDPEEVLGETGTPSATRVPPGR